MDNIQAYLNRLGITEDGYWSDDRSYYIIPLSDSNAFARTYTKLDQADWLHLVEGDLSLQEQFSSLMYINNDVVFTLKSDFLNDKYYLEVREEL